MAKYNITSHVSFSLQIPSYQIWANFVFQLSIFPIDVFDASNLSGRFGREKVVHY